MKSKSKNKTTLEIRGITIEITNLRKEPIVMVLPQFKNIYILKDKILKLVSTKIKDEEKSTFTTISIVHNLYSWPLIDVKKCMDEISFDKYLLFRSKTTEKDIEFRSKIIAKIRPEPESKNCLISGRSPMDLVYRRFQFNPDFD